jgi:tRNA-Thr(GGU) m(6)t(6)A37 methyltransferase TsaA
MGYLIEAVGHVRGGREDATDDDWGESRAVIELDPSWFGPEALSGLSAFSHAEIIYLFDRVTADEVEYGARHPRGRTDWPKVGIFAQRGKSRPNRLGVCVARIVGVEGLNLTVEGLDAIDGTPVIDIKPVIKGFLPRGEVSEPAWAAEIMKDYW